MAFLGSSKHETFLEEDFELTKKLFDVNKNVVSKHVIKNERLGTETTYLSMKKIVT